MKRFVAVAITGIALISSSAFASKNEDITSRIQEELRLAPSTEMYQLSKSLGDDATNHFLIQIYIEELKQTKHLDSMNKTLVDILTQLKKLNTERG